MGVAAKTPRVYDPTCLRITDVIKASPVGAGELSEITCAGYPKINGIAVAWCIREDGATFDPYGHTRKPDFNEEHWYDRKAIDARRAAK